MKLTFQMMPEALIIKKDDKILMQNDTYTRNFD